MFCWAQLTRRYPKKETKNLSPHRTKPNDSIFHFRLDDLNFISISIRPPSPERSECCGWKMNMNLFTLWINFVSLFPMSFFFFLFFHCSLIKRKLIWDSQAGDKKFVFNWIVALRNNNFSIKVPSSKSCRIADRSWFYFICCRLNSSFSS